MRYIVVNLTKRECFRPIELGAPHGSPYTAVGAECGPYDWPWLIHLATLLEFRGQGSSPGTAVEPWQGSWVGDRVVIVREDEDSGCFLPEDLGALKALGADTVKDFQHLLDNCEDRTDELKAAWPRQHWVYDSRFRMITQPRDYSWVTPEELRERLRFAKEKGADFYRGYVRWLQDLPRLPRVVLTLLEEEDGGS